MEFSRRAEKAPAIGKEMNLHTYFDGSRCDLPEFEFLKNASKDQGDRKSPRIYNILDGCFVLGFLDEQKAFFTLTYNTYAKVYELGFLTKSADTKFKLYYGSLVGNKLKLKSSKTGDEKQLEATVYFENGIAGIEVDYEGMKRKFGNL
jgi:hypothetical protein